MRKEDVRVDHDSTDYRWLSLTTGISRSWHKGGLRAGLQTEELVSKALYE